MDNDKKTVLGQKKNKKILNAKEVVTRGFILPQTGSIPPIPPVKPPRKD